MKKIGLLTTLLFGSLLLAGCNCNCNCDKSVNEDETLNENTEFCLDNGGTHSLIHTQIAVYGECAFPSGVSCTDDILLTEDCYFKPNLESIDTEEERITGCEENVQGWVDEMIQGATFYGVEWSDETNETRDEEGNLTLISRELYAKYDQDGNHYILPGVCEANFVDGSLGVMYDQAYIDE